MRTRRRYWILAVAAGGLWVLAVTLQPPPGSGADRTVRLSVTRGPVHLAPPVWRSWLALQLPERWAVRFGLGPSQPVQSTYPVLWVSAKDPAWLEAVTGPHSIAPFLKVEDSQGFANSLGLGAAGNRWRGQTGSAFLQLRAFPRRVGRQQVRFWWPDGREFISEARFPQSDMTKSTPWSAAHLPATCVAEGTEVVLEALTVTANPAVPKPTALAVFRVPQVAEGVTSWGVAGLKVADATGNNVTAKVLAMGWAGAGRVEVRFVWPLWSDETAWELRVGWVPIVPEALLPAEWAAVGPLAVPANDAILPLRQTLELRHGRITLLGLVGEHATLPSREHDVQGLTTLELNYDPAAAGTASTLTLLRVQDEEGHEIETEPLGGQSSSWGLKVPPQARTLSFVLATYRPRETVFRVKPEFRMPRRGS